MLWGSVSPGEVKDGPLNVDFMKWKTKSLEELSDLVFSGTI